LRNRRRILDAPVSQPRQRLPFHAEHLGRNK
jgi:hypothetical protein